jgi:hypothetical protein
MGPELSRRLGRALGTREVTPAERATVAKAAEAADTWEDLPEPVRKLVTAIEERPTAP